MCWVIETQRVVKESREYTISTHQALELPNFNKFSKGKSLSIRSLTHFGTYMHPIYLETIYHQEMAIKTQSMKT